MKGLVETLLELVENWNTVFPQQRTTNRAIGLCFSFFLAMGRKTVTRALSVAGRDQCDWSADYRLFSRCQWSPCDLFRPILKRAAAEVDDSFINVAFDDTLLRKTGKKIKNASWQRDPLSPPFQVNFVWGLRYLQASIVLPLYGKGSSTPPRAIPVQLTQLPKFKRPRKKAPQDEWDAYRALTKKHNSSTEFVKQLRYLRSELNLMGHKDKSLLVTVDNSYCNKTCLSADILGTWIIGRAKKSARLFYRSTDGSRKFYCSEGFTPDEIRHDEQIPYISAPIFYGGGWREIHYKEVKEVFWRGATKRKPLRLIVIAPTPYRRDRSGHMMYRDPAYLLTTDLETQPAILVQKYFDRWQIEVNFKEEKDLIGLGQQQVWSEKSIPRLPVFLAASYATLILSSVLAFKDQRDEMIFGALPKWRSYDQRRPSCLDLITLLRKELLMNPQLLRQYDLHPTLESIIFKSAG